MKSKSKNRQNIENIENSIKGFTLIEMLVVIAIIGILSAVSFASFRQGNRSRSVALGTDVVVGAIRTAQTDSLSPQAVSNFSACNQGMLPAYFTLHFNTSLNTFTFLAYDKCGDQPAVLQTYALPQNVRVKSSGLLYTDTNGNVVNAGASGNMDIKFSPPFSQMIVSTNGNAAYVKFDQVTIAVETIDSLASKNVFLNGISASVDTDVPR